MLDNKQRLRSAMIRSREFLAKLYQSNTLTAKKILSGGSDFEIRTLIQVIHRISIGSVLSQKKIS